MLKLIKEIFSKSSGDKEILAVVRSRSFLSSSMILVLSQNEWVIDNTLL